MGYFIVICFTFQVLGKQAACFVKQYDELYGEENDVEMEVA